MFKKSWGIKLKRDKELTKDKSIEEFVELDYYEIPVIQHIGKEGRVLVKTGARVKRYEPLTLAEENMSLPIHSPVSGEIEKIYEKEIDGRVVEFIRIKNDFLYEEYDFMLENNFIENIKSLGLAGMGGAGFPTYIKLKLSIESNVNTLIVNGSECEPYLTCDFRQMKEKIKELIEGIKILQKELNLEKVYIGVEESEIESLVDLKERVKKEKNIELKKIPTIYPIGNEKQLIDEVVGIELLEGELPSKKGLLVLNVSTIINIYEGIVNRKPLVERVVTVYKKGKRNAKNYLIKIGTPIDKILEKLDINSENVIKGGPMNGKAFSGGEVVTKGTTGIIKLDNRVKEMNPCIRCGKCIDVCPMGLLPLKFYELDNRKKYKKMIDKHSLLSCIKCGACEYICPSKLPLMDSIFKGIEKSKEEK